MFFLNKRLSDFFGNKYFLNDTTFYLIHYFKKFYRVAVIFKK